MEKNNYNNDTNGNKRKLKTRSSEMQYLMSSDTHLLTTGFGKMKTNFS